MVVSEDFFNPSVTYNITGFNEIDQGISDVMHEASLNGNLTNTTSSQCMEAYAINFVSKSRNVLLVTTDADTSNNSIIYAGLWDAEAQIPYAWICGDGWDRYPYTDPPSAVCSLSKATAATSDWKLGSHHISYCMIQEVIEKCQLSFSLPIMLVVIFVNIAKACISKSTPPTLLSSRPLFPLSELPYFEDSRTSTSFAIHAFRIDVLTKLSQ